MSLAPFYGRKWEIIVTTPDGQTAWRLSDDSFNGQALRCTFNIERVGYHVPWYAEITIWNLSEKLQLDIITKTKEGMLVSVKAGYQHGAYGTIFTGEIFQPLFSRENVTDFILTLNCLDGLGLIASNICAFSLEAGYDYAGTIAEMCKKAHSPIKLGKISNRVEKKTLPRGKVFFGEPSKYIRQLDQDQGTQTWLNNGELNVSHIDDAPAEVALRITPESGLIGTPEQTDNGVIFRTLLNPLLDIKNPPMAVKLDMTTIRQAKVRQGQLVSPLDENGFYKVARVVHIGDTRGDDWYTEVTGINLIGNVSALLGFYAN